LGEGKGKGNRRRWVGRRLASRKKKNIRNEGMTRPPALKTLVMLASIMNAYRDTWRPSSVDRISNNPISRIAIPFTPP
jgi:hypothetical protein